jgi:hypothetical protein
MREAKGSRLRDVGVLSSLLVAGVFFLLPSLAFATGGSGPLRATEAGPVVIGPDGSSKIELLDFNGGLAPALLKLANGESTRVEAWPAAPGVRGNVVFTRRDIYAPDARIVKIEGNRAVEIPRSRLVFFFGKLDGSDEGRAVVSVDPDRLQFWGLTFSAGEIHEILPPDRDRPRHLVAQVGALRRRGEPAPDWRCGQEEIPGSWAEPSKTSKSDQLLPMANPNPPTLAATLAIDTDNEFMSLKFADNTTNATNYIAQLVASVTTIYERDSLVRINQGTAILRPSSTPDPYTQNSNGSASSAELNEFENYWYLNYGSTPRTIATILSGKQPDNNSASGIAAINSLCSTTRGYSFCKVFKISYLVGDTLIVAHEMGHNFGSPHTHCYSPPADNCYNQEFGPSCFSGTTSCPSPFTINTAGGVAVTGVTGTLMSYCHLLSGCEPDQTKQLVFHPRSLTEYINSKVSAATGSCIFATAPSPLAITNLSVHSGPTTGGTVVVVSGSNFQAGATVTIGGAAASATFVSSTMLSTTTPARPVGPADVVVTNPGDGGSATLPGGFVYTATGQPPSMNSIAPCRVIDTRNAADPFGGLALSPGQVRSFTIPSGSCPIPADAAGVVLNVTVADATAPGTLTLFPGNGPVPGTNTISFVPGKNRANNVVLGLVSGVMTVKNFQSSGMVNLIVDVNAYFR